MSAMINTNTATAMVFLFVVICSVYKDTASVVFYQKNKQATRIQALARGYLARKELKRASVAASKIQTQWRRYSANKKNEAATQIQAIARGYMVRTELSRAHHAATKIQAAWRVHHAEKVESVTRIQAFARSVIAMKGLRLAVNAATKIQCQWRVVFSKTTNAVTSIQGFARCAAARQKLQALKFDHQCALNIKAWYDCERRHRLAREGRHNAATKIQAFVRATFDRSAFHRQIAGFRCLQAVTRGNAVRSVPLSEHTAKPPRLSFPNTWEALVVFIATVIFWPVLLFQENRKKQRKKSLYLKITSALLIQKRWRQRAARKDAERKTAAARLIQTRWRGFAQRSEYKLRREGLQQQIKFWGDKLWIQRKLFRGDYYLTLKHEGRYSNNKNCSDSYKN